MPTQTLNLHQGPISLRVLATDKHRQEDIIRQLTEFLTGYQHLVVTHDSSDHETTPLPWTYVRWSSRDTIVFRTFPYSSGEAVLDIPLGGGIRLGTGPVRDSSGITSYCSIDRSGDGLQIVQPYHFGEVVCVKNYLVIRNRPLD